VRAVPEVKSKLISQSRKCMSRKTPLVSQICAVYSLIYKSSIINDLFLPFKKYGDPLMEELYFSSS
jgi:hypothetical protein